MKHNKQSASIVGPSPGAVAVVASGKDEVVHLSVLSDLGTDIVTGLLNVSDKYYKLCVYVREHCIDTRMLRNALEPLGFRKERISEIYRVATSSGAIWSEFLARSLSFRRTLELTRGTIQVLYPAGNERDASWVPDDESRKRSAVEAEESLQARRLSKGDKLELLVNQLAAQAESSGMRGRTFVCENGWSVKVFKTVKPKTSKGGVE